MTPPDLLTIGFDADDTLWHNETIFERVHERFRDLLSRYHDATTVDRVLYATEMRNLDLYGYGVKAFMLSSIETAIALTEGQIGAAEIQQILGLGREMLEHPVELLDGALETVAALAPAHRVLLITKGDLRDQERKLEKSGLSQYFAAVEIVSEKNETTYQGILRRHGIEPRCFLMVGNSLKSDIQPVLSLGGLGAYVPYHLTWAAERIEQPPHAPGRFFQLASLRELPALIERWRPNLSHDDDVTNRRSGDF